MKVLELHNSFLFWKGPNHGTVVFLQQVCPPHRVCRPLMRWEGSVPTCSVHCTSGSEPVGQALGVWPVQPGEQGMRASAPLFRDHLPFRTWVGMIELYPQKSLILNIISQSSMFFPPWSLCVETVQLLQKMRERAEPCDLCWVSRFLDLRVLIGWEIFHILKAPELASLQHASQEWGRGTEGPSLLVVLDMISEGTHLPLKSLTLHGEKVISPFTFPWFLNVGRARLESKAGISLTL